MNGPYTSALEISSAVTSAADVRLNTEFRPAPGTGSMAPAMAALGRAAVRASEAVQAMFEEWER